MRRTLFSAAFAAALATTLLTALLAGCGSTVINPVTGEAERTVLDEGAEIALGKKENLEVLKEYQPYKNPSVQAYVNDLGQRLASQSHRKELQWHFTVLDSPEINAFALPGGYVYVTRGIMAYMGDEADLAGVIGHEIGHVTARHGAQRATKQQDAGIGVFFGTILGVLAESYGVTGAGRAAGDLSQTVAAGYVASYGREQELQADGLGAEYLSRVRYDPRNMINVINVLKDQERFAADQAQAEGRPAPSKGDWLASHPSNDQRLQMITQLASQYNKGNYGDEGRVRYLKVLQGAPFGDGVEQGFVRGRNFYHVPMGFALTAPVGWQVQNEADKLTLINAARDAVLVVNVVPPKLGSTHADIFRNVFKPAQMRAEPTTLNALQATRFVGARKNVQGQLQAIEATVVSGPKDTNYLLVYNAKNAQAMQGAKGALREAEGSFRAMTAQDQAAAKPWVIKTVPYPKGGFAELAKSSPIANPEKQLRLINGFYSGGEPPLGQLVKVVDAP
jgi:predicted Zn-dependent protease